MPITPQQILEMPDKHTRMKGLFPSVVRALLEHRDQALNLDLNENWFDLDGPEADALDERIVVHSKVDKFWDDGDGRNGLHVVAFDGLPVAIVHEEGYDHYEYGIVVVDLVTLDEMADAVRALRKNTLQEVDETALDVDVLARLGYKETIDLAPDEDDSPAP